VFGNGWNSPRRPEELEAAQPQPMRQELERQRRGEILAALEDFGR